MTADPASVAGRALPVEEATTLLVIGAGRAGTTAAIAAARQGIATVLVDENPVDVETMGSDVPLHYGGRASGAARNRNAMTEAVLAANPLIAEAFEAGVDVRLGTQCWGLYVPRPAARFVGAPVAGLSDGVRSWQIGFRHAIVASGRRDMGLAFPGWDLPGVMGAAAAVRLAGLGALAARRAVVLGSGADAVATVAALAAAGVTVEAVVECAAAPLCPADRLAAHGVGIVAGHVVEQAEGGADGVTGAILAPVDGEGRRTGGPRRTVACDTIVLAVAAVPAIELLEAAGAVIAFDAGRGGQAPVVDGAGRTSLGGVHAVGDAAGVWPEKTRDTAVAEAEALRAVAAVAAAEGLAASGDLPPPAAPGPPADLDGALKRWVRASVIEASGEPYVCQCEEVTAREILEVRPPRYLGWRAPTQKPADLASLLGDGPPSPEQVKRLTRAGMGVCQGRRCREQAAVLLPLGAGRPLGEVPVATYPAPAGPLPLSVLAETAEDPAMAANWEVWFGITAQWVPPSRVPPRYTAAAREAITGYEEE